MTSVANSSHQAALKQRQHDNKLTKRIMREAGTAIVDYNMIEDGDKVMVCLSGGKDSYSMLDILLALQKRAPIHFDIIAVNLDQKQPGFPAHVLPDYLTQLGVPFHIENQDTYSIVKRLIPEGKTTCSLCSRLRRGILYRVAAELGATKIALGHHRDDILATFFLNLFYAAKLKSMPPKLVSDDGRHTVIRPLAYIAEKDLIAYSELKQFPIIPCNLCGSQENLKRQEVGRMIAAWEKESPKKVWNTFKALSAITPSHLMDRNLFDFAGLRPTGIADENGDKAFDAETFADAADTTNTANTDFVQANDDDRDRHGNPSTQSADAQAAGTLTSGNPSRARTIRIQSL
ncbi:MAG: tRNA 2-thiocytidine(32) synthetase TtcA [Advenella sp.]|uniref:tRNA 2-thiocytidine(32) synthetase TtcA n=1 Tax=unclassified Advenella TaxID=2685285 RepID=UPI0018686298|nr:tRNA 2-thiocytidine(32) synthetase TtcA [Advenella sp. FME57]